VSWQRLLIGIGVALAAAVAVQAVLSEFLELERTRALVERRLSEAAGLEARVEGGLELRLFPAPHLRALDVRLANLPGRPSPSLLTIETLDLVLDSWRAMFGRLAIERLKLTGVELHLESDAEGRFRVEHHADSLVDEKAADPLDFRLRSFEVERARLFWFDGVREVGTTLSIAHLTLDAADFDAPIALSAAGDVDGAHFDLRGETGSLAALLAPVPAAAFPIRFAGELLEASVEAEGSVAAPLDLAGFDVRFDATLQDLMRSAREAGRDVPRLGPVAVSGRVSDTGGAFALRELHARIAGDSPLTGVIRGSIGDLANLTGIDLTADLEAEDLAFLAPGIGRRLPTDLALSAHVALADSDGSLGIAGNAAFAAPDGSLTLEATGEGDDLSRLDELDVRVRLRARDLAAVARVFEIDAELPAVGPIDATGRLGDRGERLALDELSVRVGPSDAAWASIAGSVDDLAAFRGVSLHVTLDASDARLALAHLGRPLPELGPLRGRAHLHDRDGSLGVEGLELRAGRGDGIDLQIRGSFGDLRAIDEVSFDMKLAAPSTADIGSLFEIEVPVLGPVAFDGRVTGSSASVRADGSLRLARTALSGSWAGSFPAGERARFSARVESPHVHLEELQLALEGAVEARSRAAGADPPTVSSWRHAPIPFHELRAFDADVGFSARRVTGRDDLDLRDVRASLTLADGVLSVNDAATGSENGAAALELQIDASGPVPMLALRGELRNVDLVRLTAQLEQATEPEGRVDASFHLTSRGESGSEIRSHLAGRLAARLRDGNVASRYGQRFVKQIALLAIPDLRLHPRNPVDCLALTFDIEDGIADLEALRMDAEQVSLTGSGTIDLAAGTYALRLTPQPRDPSLISVAAAVDVTGPLGEPKFTPVRRTIATSAMRAVLRNALKPAELILRPLRLSEAEVDASPCEDDFDPVDSAPELLPDRAVR
jgi:uncharacterized protein involved in outer membrane biogenesis